MRTSLVVLLAILMASMSAVSLAAECNNSKDIVGVSYLVTAKNKQSGELIRQEKLNFWRMNKQVAYEYPERKYIEIWNLVSNGQIRPIRYFDNFKRGIEYQPMDVNNGKGDRNWSAKNNIVSDTLRNQLNVATVSGDACDKKQVYAKDENTSLLAMSWLNHYSLPESMKYQQGEELIEWQVQKIVNDPAAIVRPFEKRTNYQTTDFADIGDSESDPVISKLIKQGFIEHHGMH